MNTKHAYFMRRWLMLLLVGCMATGGLAAAEEPLSVLELCMQHEGNPAERYYIEFACQPTVTCYHQVLTLEWLDEELGMQKVMAGTGDGVSIRLMRASESIPDAVAAPEQVASTVIFDIKQAGIVRVRGINQGARVQAFAPEGRVVATAVAASGGEAVISLKAQPRGMYLISVNQRETFKILKP